MEKLLLGLPMASATATFVESYRDECFAPAPGMNMTQREAKEAPYKITYSSC